MTKTPVPPNAEGRRMNWFDQQFSQIGRPMLILLTILFAVLMWIFSGIGVLATRDPVAHRKAKVIFIVITVYIAICAVGIYILVHHPAR